ncbi:MAG: hypothetical protein NWE77_06590, partial [Candidatus Bathyarchaeota archaeon]|nr:hypothetical protein [Candidatus Bathyarchaeota archaeon]
MIGKLFPRILNKSSDKSAIKPSEFIDAINVLVSSDDGGDGNVIKKIDGTISAVIEDPENFPFDAFNETIIGHLVDESKKRVYYFAVSESESSIYLIKESPDGQGLIFMCLLRDPDLNFSEEDFVAADVVKVPKKNIDSGEDLNFGGVTGDEEPSFQDFGEGEGVSSLSVLQEPPSFLSFEITGAEWTDTSQQGDQFTVSLFLSNFGQEPAIVDIFATFQSNPYTPDINFFVAPVGGATQVTVPGFTQAFEVEFVVTLDITSSGLNPVITNLLATEPINVTLQLGVSQFDDGNLFSAPIVDQYETALEFFPPSKKYPKKAILQFANDPSNLLDD